MGNLRTRAFCYLIVYYGFAYYLPDSYTILVGKLCNWIRVHCVRQIFERCGKVSTMNRRVRFGSGRRIQIGDNSGIGANVSLPSNTLIGDNVIIGRNTFILLRNHRMDDPSTPIVQQGYMESKQTIIEDDVWVGMNTLMTPGRRLSKGTVIGMGTVLTKDYPEYSIVAGNPGRLIRSRLDSPRRQTVPQP